MKTIVITGSTRGIGYGLADAFLARDCAVVVSGRTQEAVDAAVAELAAQHEADRVYGTPCDVTDPAQVQALWDRAQAHFGQIDIWINNAGLGSPQMDFWDGSPEQMEAVVTTNLLGAMYGSRVAIRGMLEQGSGSVYNMEGLGSNGNRVAGLTLYGTTKYGLRYLNEGLARETKGTPVLVGALLPGMVATEFLTGQYEGKPEEWERVKRIFNILADRVEDIAPWFADRVLANTKNGARFSYLGRFKVLARFMLAPFRKRDPFAEPPQ